MTLPARPPLENKKANMAKVSALAKMTIVLSVVLTTSEIFIFRFPNQTSN